MTDYFRIGKIIKVFGIKGEVKVFPTTDDVKRYDDLKSFYLNDSESADGNDFLGKDYNIVSSIKYVKNTPILKIKGIDSIEDAYKLIGKNIYVKRSDAVTLKDNEFYVMDLINATCYKDDKDFGKVIDVLKTKSNDILLIRHLEKEIMIPMVSDFIEGIDIENSKIILKTVEGLL